MWFVITEKIKDLLAEGDVDSLTRLVLVNAIYFKGSWERKFTEEHTREQQFKINTVSFHKGLYSTPCPNYNQSDITVIRTDQSPQFGMHVIRGLTTIE